MTFDACNVNTSAAGSRHGWQPNSADSASLDVQRSAPEITRQARKSGTKDGQTVCKRLTASSTRCSLLYEYFPVGLGSRGLPSSEMEELTNSASMIPTLQAGRNVRKPANGGEALHT